MILKNDSKIFFSSDNKSWNQGRKTFFWQYLADLPKLDKDKFRNMSIEKRCRHFRVEVGKHFYLHNSGMLIPKRPIANFYFRLLVVKITNKI